MLLLNACKSEPSSWHFERRVSLNNISPIGLSMSGSSLWLADGDNNRLVKVDMSGNVLDSINNISRPMHISNWKDTVYIPEFGEDKILTYSGGNIGSLEIKDSLDGPAAIDFRESEIAIADFYGHSILYFDGHNWRRFGKEGKSNDSFYYPTDVQIADQFIYVADAYNHRVQVWDKNNLVYLKTIGKEYKMNATTGLYLYKDQLAVTDFENDRVLVFDLKSQNSQEINGLNKPTDVLITNDSLFITNYKSKEISLYKYY